MSMELQTVVFIAQVRIHDAKALQAAAAERAGLDGLSAHAWAAMRSGCGDDVVMLLDPGSIAGAGFEIVQSRCEVLAHGADAADGGPDSVSREQMTNVEFVVDLMEHSQHGALIQAFVLHAIQVYAKSVAKKSPAELDTPLVAGAAWHGCAVELCSKLNGHLGR